MMILQQEPPSLESENPERKFSKGIKEVVKLCLTKDPAERPSAAKLLEHKFFKTAHDHQYLKKSLLEGLPSLADRVKVSAAQPPHGVDSARETSSIGLPCPPFLVVVIFFPPATLPSSFAKEEPLLPADEPGSPAFSLPRALQYLRGQGGTAPSPPPRAPDSPPETGPAPGVSSWNFDVAELKRQAEAMDKIQVCPSPAGGSPATCHLPSLLSLPFRLCPCRIPNPWGPACRRTRRRRQVLRSSPPRSH